jgi:hypothetical protein
MCYIALQGILDAYLNTLRQVRLHGPTIFSQILSSAIHQVSPSKDLSEFRSQKKQQYSILLIITVIQCCSLFPLFCLLCIGFDWLGWCY